MKLSLSNGITSLVLRVKIRDTASITGGGKTGLTSASSGLIISTIAENEATATAYTVAASNVETITTLGTFAAPTASKCRFKEVDATNHPGLYEIQIADARWAVSGARSVVVTVSGVSGAAQEDVEIQLDGPAGTPAAKTLKYVQLMTRKDAAIATDNATELTAINASGGSGAGAFANTTDSEEAIRDRGDAAWVTGSGSGTGAYPITVTVNDGSTALQNAIVRVTEGSNTFTVTTNASGQGSFSLDAATYTVSVTKAGYSFTPTTRTVTGSQAGTLVNALSMTVVTITPASDPSETNAYLTTRDAHGDALAAVSLEFRLISTASAASGASYPTTWMTATSNGAGLLTIALLRLAKYEGRRNVTGRYGRPVQFTTTDTSTYQLPEVLGANDAE